MLVDEGGEKTYLVEGKGKAILELQVRTGICHGSSDKSFCCNSFMYSITLTKF